MIHKVDKDIGHGASVWGFVRPRPWYFGEMDSAPCPAVAGSPTYGSGSSFPVFDGGQG